MKQLSIFYQNVRGLKSKLPSLQIIAAEYCPSVICIVETHLSENDPNFSQNDTNEGDSNLFQIQGYNVIRNDRNGLGGGCLIAYKEVMKTLVTELDVKADNHECLWITIGNDVTKVKLGVVYMPGENTRKQVLQNAYKEIECEIKSTKVNEQLLICGDFNAKMEMEEQMESAAGEVMNKFLTKNGLIVMNLSDKCQGKWTRVEGNSKSAIDYVLTTSDCYVKNMVIDEEKNFSVYYHKTDQGQTKIMYSDHNAIITKIEWKSMLELRNGEEKIRLMTKKGLMSYQRRLEEGEVSSTINTDNDIKEEYLKWERNVTEIYESEKRSVKKQKMWKVNRKLIQNMKNLKRNIRKRKFTGREKFIARERIKLIKQHCEEEIRLKNRKAVEGITEKIKATGRTNLEPFWKHSKLNNHKESKTGITIRDKEGNRIDNKERILKEYENYYHELLKPKPATTTEGKETEEIVNSAVRCLGKLSMNEPTTETTEEDINQAVKTLKERKASDSSGWRNEHVIYGGAEMKQSLKKLFTMVDEQKQIPESWEKMWIKAIFKDKRIKKLDKTRGLFMTNIVGKIKEKVIKARNDVAWEKTASTFQCGGRKGTSTIDHTLTVLEIIQRNKYLGKPTYLVFIDMEKCFDKLWLESGILELWKSGMSVVDANTIYEMNKRASITIDTPIGKTNIITVENTVKQGTIYGPRICSKEMEQINNLGRKTVTHYGPRIEIGILAYVDDLTSAGSKDIAEKAISNANIIEVKKKATINLTKSKYMIINKKVITESDELKTSVKNGQVSRTAEYEYLGTWINQKANCELNIKKRKEKCQLVILKIEEMASCSRVGKLSTTMKLELYNIVLIPTLLYNMAAWGRLEKKENEELEKFQGEMLKRLLKLPITTPYLGILYETGIWRIRDVMVYKKIMLLHNILTSNPDRIIKRIIIEQENYPIPNCWLENLKTEALAVGIYVKLDEMTTKTKACVKKETKAQITENFIKYIQENKTTKLRTVSQNEFKKKIYIDEGKLNENEIKEVMLIRLHMSKLKSNYKNNEDSTKCQFCYIEDETTEHLLFHCRKVEYLRQDMKLKESDMANDDSLTTLKLARLMSRMKKIML